MAVEVVVKRVPLVANGVIHKPGASVKIVETLAVALERRGMCVIVGKDVDGVEEPVDTPEAKAAVAESKAVTKARKEGLAKAKAVAKKSPAPVPVKPIRKKATKKKAAKKKTTK
ncbi:MAG: hypothetical protein ACYSW8_31835 [Planctomycetota bacterium]|jgi:hypothetical protein